MVTVTIIIIFILIGLFIFRQFFKGKSVVETSKDKFPFMVQILIGIVIILLGLFLTFGITVYSLKEQDNNGFYGFIISFTFIGLGIHLLMKVIKRNKNQR